jgi:DNA-binding MarR family transcriptional regulator
MAAGEDTADAATRLSVAVTRLRSRLRAESGLHGTGLSISQVSVLKSVVDAGPVTAATLALAQHVSPQSIAQNLAVLKTAGLVRADRDPADGRKTLVTATDPGAELLTSLRAGRRSFLVRAIETLVAPGEQADLERAIELLERFAAADLDGAGHFTKENP